MPGKDDPVSNTILVKKYPNRRLYNTETSTYITVADVAGLIRKGFRIQVVDLTTGDDITAIVLTQIIMNKAKEDNAILPVSLLHLAIQYGESHLHEFFETYLETAIRNYLGLRKQMDDQFRAYMKMGMDFSSMAEKTMKQMDPMNIFSAASAKKDPE